MGWQSSQPRTQHVVAIPYPAQGHINPMLQLCRQLVPFGFSFTFINTHHIHQRVQRARRRCPAAAASDAHYDVTNNNQEHPHEGLHAHDPYEHELLPAHGVHQCGTHTPDAPDACGVGVGVGGGGSYANRDEDCCRLTDAHHGEPAYVRAHPGNDAHPHDDDSHGCGSIRMVSVAGGLPPEDHAHHSSWARVFNAAQEMQAPVEELIAHIIQEQGVAFILSDIMFRWAGTTAHKFSLPWVCFWPASAASCSVMFHFSELAAEGKCVTLAEKAGIGEGGMVEGIPGLPATHLHDLPKVWDKSTWKVEHVVLDSFAAGKKAGWLLLNTFEDLEGQVLEALRKHLPTVALGPLLPSCYMLHPSPDTAQESAGSILSLFPEDERCLAWLDSQSPSSVLFISFGSISLRSEQQLQELALGVQASGCPFLWVRRPDVSSGLTHDDICPDNDNAHHADPSSLIVSWAPQLQVLSHPSVRGFITHCGWNSVIESMSMGVPMICWADTGERMSNQRFVVEFWKCGVPMVADNKRVAQHIDVATLVERDEVEKSVKFLMFEDAGAPIRARAAQLKGIATRAFQDSQTRLKEFVQALEQKRAHMPT